MSRQSDGTHRQDRSLRFRNDADLVEPSAQPLQISAVPLAARFGFFCFSRVTARPRIHLGTELLVREDLEIQVLYASVFSYFRTVALWSFGASMLRLSHRVFLHRSFTFEPGLLR